MPDRGTVADVPPVSQDRGVSGLVTARASRHLGYATVALSAMLALVVGVLAFLQVQGHNVEENFTDNDSVHYIQVSYRQGDVTSGGLRFTDRDAIAKIATAAGSSAVQVVTMSRIPFAISSESGQQFFVYGLTGDAADLLGAAEMGDGTAVGSVPAQRLELDVPVVSVEADGMSSDMLERVSLSAGPLPQHAPLAAFQTPDPSSLYVNEATFSDLVAAAFDGLSWTEFQQRNDGDGDAIGFDAVASFFVHVDDLGNVDDVGQALDEAGYATSYTLRAFDDLSGTLSSGRAAGLTVMVAGLLLCLVLTFTNLQSYLNLAHRDMGILRHQGYSGRRVARIYRIRLRAVVTRASLAPLVLAVVVGATVLRVHALDAAIDVLVVVAVLGLVFAAMALVQVPRHANRPVLALLKLDRQFE